MKIETVGLAVTKNVTNLEVCRIIPCWMLKLVDAVVAWNTVGLDVFTREIGKLVDPLPEESFVGK